MKPALELCISRAESDCFVTCHSEHTEAKANIPQTKMCNIHGSDVYLTVQAQQYVKPLKAFGSMQSLAPPTASDMLSRYVIFSSFLI